MFLITITALNLTYATKSPGITSVRLGDIVLLCFVLLCRFSGGERSVPPGTRVGNGALCC